MDAERREEVVLRAQGSGFGVDVVWSRVEERAKPGEDDAEGGGEALRLDGSRSLVVQVQPHQGGVLRQPSPPCFAIEDLGPEVQGVYLRV